MSIDDRLRKIHLDYGLGVGISEDDFIAQTHEAFADEGYDRFEKELEGKVFAYLKSEDDVTTTLSICCNAAKKAAGIE